MPNIKKAPNLCTAASKTKHAMALPSFFSVFPNSDSRKFQYCLSASVSPDSLREFLAVSRSSASPYPRTASPSCASYSTTSCPRASWRNLARPCWTVRASPQVLSAPEKRLRYPSVQGSKVLVAQWIVTRIIVGNVWNNFWMWVRGGISRTEKIIHSSKFLKKIWVHSLNLILVVWSNLNSKALSRTKS